jgi:two-component system, OmpR family, response regulator
MPLATRIRTFLTEVGFAVDVANDGGKGWQLGDTLEYDCAVVDLALPGLPGLEVLKRWRDAGRTMPVMILTGRNGWVERVKGLNAGADEYMEKPFQAPELIARLRSLMRRSAGKPNPVTRIGNFEFNSTTGQLSRAGQTIDLTAQELRILSYLVHRSERIVSQGELAEHIYSLDEARESNTVEVYIGRLRKKIGRDTIRTVRGLGYRIGIANVA